MKIDVEGYEVECLKGSQKALEITKKVVHEYHSESLRSEVISLLTNKQFRIKDVNGIIYAERR
jgi:hypothetical protein